MHAVVNGPRLQATRRKLQAKVGDAFDCVATMLGGRPRYGQDMVGNGGTKREVLNAMLEVAEATQTLKSRVPTAECRIRHRP